MKRVEKRATTIPEIKNNFYLHELEPGSPFYVDLDRARNKQARNAPRKRIVYSLEECSKDNRDGGDEYSYCRLLFAGHRSCGKTTELRYIQRELEKDYHIIYIPDIKEKTERISSQRDFLYYVMSELIIRCKDDPVFMGAVGDRIEKLYRHLEEKIFGTVVKTEKLRIDDLIQHKSTVGASIDYWPSVVKLMTKLTAKGTFEEETQRELNVCISNYFDEFMELANSILLSMQKACFRYKEQKLLLLVLDGVDKVSPSVAEKIFLDGSSFLAQLNVSMIVTFPICLMYSPRQPEATDSFDNIHILSMVKVHERNGSDCDEGIQALMDIVEARMDIDALMENREDLKKAIRMSGGNIRDLFRFIREASISADLEEDERISAIYLEETYEEATSTIRRRLVRSYLRYLSDVMDDKEKKDVIRIDHHDENLLTMFDAGLLIEYNGKRWCDLHPLVRKIMEERRKANLSDD